MVVVNAIVYRDRGDKCYTAEGFEICQIGTGKTKKEAMEDYLMALKNVKNFMVKKGGRGQTIVLLNPEHCSRRCKEGLRKIVLSEEAVELVEVGREGNVEVHFYKG